MKLALALLLAGLLPLHIPAQRAPALVIAIHAAHRVETIPPRFWNVDVGEIYQFDGYMSAEEYETRKHTASDDHTYCILRMGHLTVLAPAAYFMDVPEKDTFAALTKYKEQVEEDGEWQGMHPLN